MSEPPPPYSPPEYPQGTSTQQGGYPGAQQGYPAPAPPSQEYPQKTGYPAEQGNPSTQGYPATTGNPTDQEYPEKAGYPAEQGYPAPQGYQSQPGNTSHQQGSPAQPVYPGNPPQEGNPPSQGYPSQPQQQGYPQKAGYPAHQGNPPSAPQGYPSQQGYPAQPGNPSQAYYPQKAGYPSPDEQGNPPPTGYPQQPGNPPQQDYPQKSGYPPKEGYPAQQGYPPTSQGSYPAQQGNPSAPTHQGYPAPTQQGYLAPTQQGYPAAAQQEYSAVQRSPSPQPSYRSPSPQPSYPAAQQGYPAAAPQGGPPPQHGYPPPKQGSMVPHQGHPVAQQPAYGAPACGSVQSSSVTKTRTTVVQPARTQRSTLGGLFKSAQKAVGGAANTVVREVDRHVSSENLEMFNNGNIVSLQSRETSRCLQVSSCGVLSANGLQHDKSGHFRVVNCGQNVVLLQSAIYPSWYIANHGGRIVGNGSGDPSCKFRLHETMNGFITLESVASPNQHVGVNADGEMKPADLVRKENSAMWVPTVVCGPQPIVHVEQTTVTRSVHSHRG